jgi:ubiquinone/menaquinone biosynthesis C-methylase UbiE
VQNEPSTERVRALYERSAHRYDRTIRLFERLLRVDDGRLWLCSRAEGDVLEVGIGTGRNLPYYPPLGVELTGVDVSPAMLAIASSRAHQLDRRVDLHVGDAQALEFPDQRFNTVVFGLCLCSIPDDSRAIAEAVRVLRPGGYIVLMEHVRSPAPVVRFGQRMLDPLMVRIQADHLLREPLDHLRAEGMEIEEVRRWAWGIMEQVSARKPE